MTHRLGLLAFENLADIDGYAVGHGTNIYDLGLEQFCNFVWWMFTRNMTEQETTKFRARLWQPPKGVAPAPQSPWSPENERAAFQAFKAQTQG